MGHGGDRVWLGFWVSVGVSVVICCGGLLWWHWVGLGLCFSGVVVVLGGAGFLFRWCFVVVVLWLFAMVIPNSSEWTRQHKSLWAPQSMKIYHYATELCISETENTNLVFLVFITLTQNFWVWVMKTRLWNQAKQKKIMWGPCFFITELWVSSDITQNWPNPNRLLITQKKKKINSKKKKKNRARSPILNLVVIEYIKSIKIVTRSIWWVGKRLGTLQYLINNDYPIQIISTILIYYVRMMGSNKYKFRFSRSCL